MTRNGIKEACKLRSRVIALSEKMRVVALVSREFASEACSSFRGLQEEWG